MTNIQKGILLTLLSAVFNGSTYLIVKILLGFTNVETMLALWFFWGNLIFISFFLLTKRLKEILKDFTGNIKKLALLGLLNSLSVFFWSYGVLYGNPAGAAFIFRLEAVISVILGLILLKERFSKLEGVGVLIALVGAFVMLYQGGRLLEAGNLFMLAAAVISAVLIFLTKIYVKAINALTLAFSRSLFLFSFITMYALFLGKFQFKIQTNVFSLTLLGAFVGAFLGFFLFFKSLSFYEMSKAVAVRSIEPFFVVILSLVILGLLPSGKQLVGGTMIVAGIVILNTAASLRRLKSKEKDRIATTI